MVTKQTKTKKAEKSAKPIKTPSKKTSKEPAAPKDKWAEIREILDKMKLETLTEIKNNIKKGADKSAVNDPSGDIYDQASSERDRELGLLLNDRERNKLHSIEEALLRINEGDYGTCEECDEEIPLGRLKALPFTRHCVRCKGELEKVQAQTKHYDDKYAEIPSVTEEE